MKDLITHYTAGKKWYWYALLSLLGLYLFITILGFHPNQPGPFLTGFLYLILFGVHEISHLATSFLPPVITTSAGSLYEILITFTFASVAIFTITIS